MSEPVWYYARGDTEKGPLSTAQIKALASAGKIRPDDYVWKEGTPSWVAARELSELFPNEPHPATRSRNDNDLSAIDRQTNKPQARGLPRPRQASLGQPLGRAAIVVGLFLVLAARGCDGLARLEQRSQPPAATPPDAAAAPDLGVALWLQATFFAGTLLLAAGLLTVSFTAQGPEGWICLSLLGAIVASIYFTHSW